MNMEFQRTMLMRMKVNLFLNSSRVLMINDDEGRMNILGTFAKKKANDTCGYLKLIYCHQLLVCFYEGFTKPVTGDQLSRDTYS